MTELIPILSDRCLVVELPEGATKPEIYGMSLTFDTPLEVDEWGYDYQAVKIPEGNWRIIEMLSEVTEEQAATFVKLHATIKKYKDYLTSKEHPTNVFTKTALESLESAILAEGFTFQNNLRNPDDVCYFSRDRMIADVREYHEVQSRVLCRERCLLLGREI